MIHLRAFSHQQLQQLQECVIQAWRWGLENGRMGTQLGGTPCTSRSIFVRWWVVQTAPPGFLFVHLPREIYKSDASGCTIAPTTVADLESTTDTRHLLPLRPISDSTQPWLTPLLVLGSLPSQVTQTVILRGSYLLLITPCSGCRCFACQFPLKFGQGVTETCDHGSPGCQTWFFATSWYESSPIFSW